MSSVRPRFLGTHDHLHVPFLDVTWLIRCLLSPSKLFPFFDSPTPSTCTCTCTCTSSVRGVQAADSSMTAIDSSAVAVGAVAPATPAHTTLPSTRYVAVDLFGEPCQQYDVMQ